MDGYVTIGIKKKTLSLFKEGKKIMKLSRDDLEGLSITDDYFLKEITQDYIDKNKWNIPLNKL